MAKHSVATKSGGRFFIVFNVGERKDVKVVKAPAKPTATWFPQPAYAEGPFKTKFDVIKRLNQMDVPASNRPEGYQTINMAKPSKAKPVVQKSKVKGLILSIAHDIASSGVDFLPGGNLDENLKALKIPKKKWGDYVAWIWDANVIGTGLTLEALQKRVANQEDIPAVKADEFAEYVKPKTRFLKWLSAVERWASENYGRMMVISVDDFVESEENGDTVKVTVKENEQFAKEAFTKGYFLKTKTGGMEYAIHDEKIWTRLHKVKEGIPI